MFLIDTNVLIERAKTRPAPKVKAWMDSLRAGQVVLCPVVAAEFLTGVFKLPAGHRGPALAFLREARRAFRWLPIDLRAAVAYGLLRSRARTKVRGNDLWLGALASVWNLTVATRNERDFKVLGVPVLNPF